MSDGKDVYHDCVDSKQGNAIGTSILSFEPANSDLMNEKPRSAKEPLLTKNLRFLIAFYVSIMNIITNKLIIMIYYN